MAFLIGKAGKDVLKGGAGDDILYGLGGNDSLWGGAGDNVLAGHEGNDTLSGGLGEDYLLGGIGNDQLDGGAGMDWAAYEDATSAVSVNLALTIAQNTLGGGIDRLIGIENLYGSAFNDTLIGDAGVNYLSGGAGDDQLVGGAGDDHLSGGAGNDWIEGGEGWDVVSYDDGLPGGVLVHLASNIATGHGVDRLFDIEGVYGTEYGDTLIGNDQSNALMGRDGDDHLFGGSGDDDYLDGGAGDDTFIFTGTWGSEVVLGGDGSDTIVFGFGPSGVTVDLAKTAAQEPSSGRTVTLDSVENVTGTAGNDTICASTEQNRLGGNGGADRFVFRSLAELGNGATADTVWGGLFSTIDLSAIDADTTKAGDQAFHFSPLISFPDIHFSGQPGEIALSYVPGTSMQILEFDVNGDKIADARLYLDGVAGSDFVF